MSMNAYLDSADRLRSFPRTTRRYYSGFEFNRDADIDADNWNDVVDTSTAPTTVLDADGGTVALVTDATDDKYIEMHDTAEWVKLGAGRRIMLTCRLKHDDVSVGEFGFGLISPVGTAGLAAAGKFADGIFIQKDKADSVLDLKLAVGAANQAAYTTKALQLVSGTDFEPTDDTFMEVALLIECDPVTATTATIHVFINGQLALRTYRTGLTATELGMFFGVNPDGSAARTLTVDNIDCEVYLGPTE